MYHPVDVHFSTEEIDILIKALTIYKDQEEGFSNTYRAKSLIDYFTEISTSTPV